MIVSPALLFLLVAAGGDGGPNGQQLGRAIAEVLHLDVQATMQEVEHDSQVCMQAGSGVYECALTDRHPGATDGHSLHCRLRQSDGEWHVIAHLANGGWVQDLPD